MRKHCRIETDDEGDMNIFSMDFNSLWVQEDPHKRQEGRVYEQEEQRGGEEQDEQGEEEWYADKGRVKLLAIEGHRAPPVRGATIPTKSPAFWPRFSAPESRW